MIVFVIQLLLMMAGDVERNPGPGKRVGDVWINEGLDLDKFCQKNINNRYTAKRNGNFWKNRYNYYLTLQRRR